MNDPRPDNFTECPLVNKNRKINVLVAADHAGYQGRLAGVGRYLLNILPRLDRNCFNIILIVLRDTASLKSELKKEGIKLIHLNRKKFDPSTLYDFVKIIRRERIRILHLHQYGTSNFGRIAGKLLGVPTILHAHGPDLNYPIYQWIADRLLAKQTHCALAVSEAVKEECVKNRAIKPHKIIVIPNAIPIENFKHWSPARCQALKSRWNIPPSAPIVGTITRFHEEKGNHYLLEAAAEILQVLPDAYFLFVGDGPLYGQLKQLARKLRIEHNVIFTGFQRDVVGMLSIFDVKAIVSNAEGYSQVLLEAMAMGKAVVATEVGGIKEILKHGETGLLVPARDSHSMTEKIIFLLQNEQERVRLGANAQRGSHQFAIHKHVRNLERQYEKLATKFRDNF